MRHKAATRNLRKELSQLLGRHDRATLLTTSHGNKLLDKARSLRTKLASKKAGLEEIAGWYLFRKLHEESFARKIFGRAMVHR